MLLVIRLINLIIFIINVKLNGGSNSVEFWALRIFGISCPITGQQLVGNIITYTFFHSIGILLNNNWIVTLIGMLINFAFTCGFYIHFFGQFDYSLHWLLFATVIVSALTCYLFEKRLKLQFIQLQQIKNMNEELKQIFDKIPEGILLFNESTQRISLTNLEFKKLFTSENQIDNDKVQNVIKDVSLRRYHLQQISDIDQNEISLKKPFLNIFEASNGDYQDECFEIIHKNQVLLTDSIISQDQSNYEIVSLSQCKINFSGSQHSMILIKNLTPVVKYEKLKVENHYYEMLTATVSHDMRTPLNAIIGLLGNLESFVVHKGKRFLPIIQNSSKFMLFLVNDLLDFFQIKNGKFRPNERPVNLRNSIRDLIEMFKIGASEKGIELIYFCQDDFPSELSVDDSRIQQVLLNLLQNALKFTFEGTIQVLMKFNRSLNEVAISVTDSGIGIKQEDREKLFQMFGKLQNTFAINTSGIGIGLIICKKIVEAFQGTIILEDQDINKKGSTFTFTIKVKEARDHDFNFNNLDEIHIDLGTYRSTQNLVEEERNYTENLDQSVENIYSIEECDSPMNIKDFQQFSDIRTKTGLNTIQRQRPDCPECRNQTDILIVDDNIFNMVTLQTILEMQFNLKSDKAMNGLEAVMKVKDRIGDTNQIRCQKHYSRNYKIIFMDGNMPIMDGLQATQEIRLLEQVIQAEQDSQNSLNIRNYKPSKAYIIGWTAYDTESFKQRCFASGMDYFIVKPVSSQILEPIINNNLF
ncbi:pas domain s-box protein [Stylonychia lemnae]|uniref:Pas domain s-box protein n=1 Tax=Stylonychia lemnae TaxID=5949 RepID=A0A078AFK7_STYLE|nr:pas domain s-box protein [Stylonychia lemnae]|eukprot:CDW81024.1 pas domain s-box protein [Stylonychia lemnae]